MKKILNYIILAVFIAAAYSCEEEATGNSVNYVTFEGTTFAFGVEIGGSTTTDIKVYTGNVTGSDRTFNISVDSEASSLDPAAYIVASTVTIPGGSNQGAFSVQISDTNISEDGETLILLLDETDTAEISSPITLNVSQVCPTNEVSLVINFDDYAGETSWEITQNEAILFSGSDYSNGDDSFTTTFCLADGIYDFTIFDSFGDGICCSYGTGSYSLNFGATVLASGASFAASETTTFSLP